MTSKLDIKITKMSGAGNTFAIVDGTRVNHWHENISLTQVSKSEFAKKICHPVFGLSVDGFLIIEPGDKDSDYIWDFYNSDGSSAEMCGNAIRCAARFCFEFISNKSKKIKFKTVAGLVETEILGDNSVQVKMPPVQIIESSVNLKLKDGTIFTGSLLNTGVPHLVKKIERIENAYAMKEIAMESRSHSDLGTQGANVTFYSVENQVFHAVTFERGVENFTLACGTGAVAAAAVIANISGKNLIQVEMPGGPLTIDFRSGLQNPLMLGGALFVCECNYFLEGLR